jgi:FdhD protein
METCTTFPRTFWRDGCSVPGTRALAEEAAVAIIYNGSTHAVLMATPADLEDLAVGFSVTEGIIDTMAAIERITVESYDLGLDIQLRVREDIADRLASRRRSMAGPVGCGMCGLESLEAASRCLAPVHTAIQFSNATIADAARTLEVRQDLNRATGAAHAAGFCRPAEHVGVVREHVGRHNALDKLIGTQLRAEIPPATGGMIVTSRVSVELVQKSAMGRHGPARRHFRADSLCRSHGRRNGGDARGRRARQEFEVFTRQDRITSEAVVHVA